MSIQPVTNATSQQSTSTTQQSPSTTILGPDAFLKILIADLQNQNPLDPQKPEDFMAQLSQLTQVQQLTNISGSISALVQNSQQGGIAQWLSSVGKKVDVQDNALSTGDQVTMQPQGSYDKVILTLTNTNTGNVQQVTFKNGDPLTYTYQGSGNVTFGISATYNGAPVSCGVENSRVVKGIQTSDSGVQVVFGDGKIMPVTSITTITE
jgi:flagellar basal-body rod modification protein FlgD